MSEAQSPELIERVNAWRQKAQAGTLSIEEMREAILLLRQGRKTASVEAAATRKSSKAPARNVDDMLSELL